MSAGFGTGFHATPTGTVDASAYERFTGRWSRLFIPAVLADIAPGSRVLDVSTGTGEAALMALPIVGVSGFVVGADISADMVSIARTKASAASTAEERAVTFEVQDAAQLSLGRTFDLAVSLFDSLNYILDPAALRSAFRRVYAHLVTGGVFAFDLNSLYALSHDLFSQTNFHGPVQHIWTAHWDRELRRCRVDMEFTVKDRETGELRHFTETHVQRAYTVPEITQWLGEAGFVKVECFGNYGTRPPGPKSDRLLFVCERG